jgi:hypothetical protein
MAVRRARAASHGHTHALQSAIADAHLYQDLEAGADAQSDRSAQNAQSRPAARLVTTNPRKRAI